MIQTNLFYGSCPCFQGYFKAIKAKIQEELKKEGLTEEEKASIEARVTTFEKGASAFVKTELGGKNFENWEFVSCTPITQCFGALI